MSRTVDDGLNCASQISKQKKQQPWKVQKGPKKTANRVQKILKKENVSEYQCQAYHSFIFLFFISFHFSILQRSRALGMNTWSHSSRRRQC